MQTNILRTSDVNSIYIFYIENYVKTKIKVNLRFIDTKEIYFAADIPAQIKKPKRKQPAEIIAYTIDGVYKSKVKILDVSISGNYLIYVTELPVHWDYTQLRQSSRKQIEADFTITFNDGYQIKSKTYDISLGGISFYVNEPIKDLYTKISGILSIELPSNSYAQVEPINIKAETKFLRMKKDANNMNNNCYVYKFMELPDEILQQLKNYMMRLL